MIPEEGNVPGLAPTLSPPGLPLGIYTNHWKKGVPHTKTPTKIGGCNALREDSCLQSYAPNDMDYDFQGLFSTEV